MFSRRDRDGPKTLKKKCHRKNIYNSDATKSIENKIKIVDHKIRHKKWQREVHNGPILATKIKSGGNNFP